MMLPDKAWSPRAMYLQFDELDIRECIADLPLSEFYKTMRSERVPGLFQDVY